MFESTSGQAGYGLGCDAANQSAVDKIFQIKTRDRSKPLLVVVPTIEMAKIFLFWNDQLDKLANKYWPGKLTVVALAKGNLAKGVVTSDGALALRVTSHPVAGFLSQKLNLPLVATSANLSGGGDVYEVAKIKQIFSGRDLQPDALLDYGQLPKCQPSTIVSVIGDKLEVLRQGEIIIDSNYV